MGILKAAMSAMSGVTKDQWKEFFICDSIPEDVIMVKGKGRNQSNNNGDSNVITDGSIVVVADGQAAIIVCQGRVVASYTDPGEHIYESEYSKGIFSKDGLSASIKDAGRRFSFGGDIPAVDERVYYINTKLIFGGKFGPISVPFQFVDKNTTLDMDCSVECSGAFSFRVAAPDRFYKLVAGNISGTYRTSEILGMMKSEFASVLMQAFGKNSTGVKRSYELPNLIPTLENVFKEQLSEKWMELRGIVLESVSFDQFNVTGKNQETITQLQRAKVLSKPDMGAGFIAGATGDAMRSAANNTNGSHAVLLGAGMQASNNNIYSAAPTKWICECGQENKGKFCTECGRSKKDI